MGKLKLPKVGLKPVRTEALHLARLLSDHAHASSSWGNFDGGLFYFGLAHIPKRTLNTLWFEAVLHIFAGSEFKLFSMCPLQVIELLFEAVFQVQVGLFPRTSSPRKGKWLKDP